MCKQRLAWIAERCEALYRRYNREEYIDPDPLSVVRRYEEVREREIVALFASSLALGRVDLILRALEELLSRLPAPVTAIIDTQESQLKEAARGFVYRFFREEHLANLLIGVRRLLNEHGCLEAAAVSPGPRAEGALAGTRGGGGAGEWRLSGAEVVLENLVGELLEAVPGPTSIMLSRQGKGSASKRLHLFLRWMVRRDRVDPGGWSAIDARELLVPVDTHMLKIARALGITARKQADIRTSREITEFFRRIRPDDPARYDFVLTRFGIRPGFFEEVVAEFGENPYTPTKGF